MNSLEEAALAYAKRAWPVLALHSAPGGRCSCGRAKCAGPGKHPRTRHGFKDASINDVQIRSWWKQWPDANVGIRTGASSGIVVLDIDPRNAGDISLYYLENEYGPLPQTVMAHTSNFGQHLYFAHPGGELQGKLDDGIDIKAESGYVVAPPSIHASGKLYRWAEGCSPFERDLAPLPEWARLVLCKDWAPSATTAATSNRPGDDFNRRGDVRDVLLRHGWTLWRPGENEHWTRPGKSEGTSATLKNNVLYVFTTNASPFEMNQAYSAFAVYALLEHGGNFEEAARELGRQGFGERGASGAQRLAASPSSAIRPAADRVVAAPPRRSFTAVPLDLLPEVLAKFAGETAAALGCEPTYVVLPMLCTVAAAIGTTRTIELKESWTEWPILWAAVIARSGTLKSPAFNAAIAPLENAQADALREYSQALEEFELQRLEYDRALAAWRRVKGGEPPRKPDAPAARRYLVSDVTIEALAPILETNARGVLVARDELAGWVRSFNAYKAQGRGGDAAGWLQLWYARNLVIDRKTGDKQTIYVPRAAASVCGTIQPGVMADTLSTEHFESGLVARLLLAQPPELVKRWSERTPSRAVMKDYENVVTTLLALPHVESLRGPEPLALPMTLAAKTIWQPWYDSHAERIVSAESDSTSSALAKIEAYAARFALIFTLVDNPAADVVDVGAVERGIALADWFAAEAERVYGFFAETEEDREHRRLVEWIERKGGAVTPRDIARSLRAYPTPKDAEAALDALAGAGHGSWEHPRPGERGGHPVRIFRLSTQEATPPCEDADAADVTPPHAAGMAVAPASAPSGPPVAALPGRGTT